MYSELTLTADDGTELNALTVCSDRLVAVLALVYDVHYFGTFSTSDIEMNPIALYGEEDAETLETAYEAYKKNEFPETTVTNEDLIEYQIAYLREVQDALAR